MKIKIQLSLSGDFNPDTITNELGVIPSISWRKGDLTKEGAKKKSAFWILTAKKSDSIYINEQLEAFLKEITPNKAKLKKLCKELGITPTFDIIIFTEVEKYRDDVLLEGEEEFDVAISYPDISIDSSTISVLNGLCADIVFDIY